MSVIGLYILHQHLNKYLAIYVNTYIVIIVKVAIYLSITGHKNVGRFGKINQNTDLIATGCSPEALMTTI